MITQVFPGVLSLHSTWMMEKTISLDHSWSRANSIGLRRYPYMFLKILHLKNIWYPELKQEKKIQHWNPKKINRCTLFNEKYESSNIHLRVYCLQVYFCPCVIFTLQHLQNSFAPSWICPDTVVFLREILEFANWQQERMGENKRGQIFP